MFNLCKFTLSDFFLEHSYCINHGISAFAYVTTFLPLITMECAEICKDMHLIIFIYINKVGTKGDGKE
jgi:hypothetical protein